MKKILLPTGFILLLVSGFDTNLYQIGISALIFICGIALELTQERENDK